MVCAKLFDLALARWSDDKPGSTAANDRGFGQLALEQLIVLADELGDVARAIGAFAARRSLPFEGVPNAA
jgi:hypothetical protein